MKQDMLYIAHRLFNYNDKIQAQLLEKYLSMYLSNICTFMPFRDTDEHNIVSDNRCKIIYNEDIKRLDSGVISLIIALFDGICKDEGVAFEIGYSFGKGIPIFLVNTDFIWYSNMVEHYLFDPVIDYMCSDYYHQYKIRDKTSFYESLVFSQESTFKEVSIRVKNLLEKSKFNKIQPSLINERYIHHDVFIDFGGCRYEYQKDYADQIACSLIEEDVNVAVSRRLAINNDMKHKDKGYKDIIELFNSDLFICLGDEIEINSGTAALLGLARAINKTIIMYESSNIEIHGENNHRMKKNLIIDNSINYIARTKKEIIDIVLKIKRDGQI